MQTPGRVSGTAILQIVSGAINLTVMWWLVGMVVGTSCGGVTALLSLGACPIGVFCGLVSWFLIPLGLLELVAGILGLANPRGGGSLMRVVAILEMVSLLCGGLGSFVAGAIGIGLLADPEVKAFLSQRP